MRGVARVVLTTRFIGNKKDLNYIGIIKNVLKKMKKQKIIKVYFLHYHLDFFYWNFRSTSEEQSGRFRQDIKIMDSNIHRGKPGVTPKRKSDNRSFLEKRERKYRAIDVNYIN